MALLAWKNDKKGREAHYIYLLTWHAHSDIDPGSACVSRSELPSWNSLPRPCSWRKYIKISVRVVYSFRSAAAESQADRASRTILRRGVVPQRYLVCSSKRGKSWIC